MNFDDIIVPSITGAIGAFVTWLAGRKKENVEVQGSEITNTQEAIKIWREMAQEMSDKVKDLSDKVDALTQEVHSLRSENADLKLKLGLDESKPNRSKRIKPDKEV
jgi:predicted RNase H-like nuclease (RuvC/YqgF family)